MSKLSKGVEIVVDSDEIELYTDSDEQEAKDATKDGSGVNRSLDNKPEALTDEEKEEMENARSEAIKDIKDDLKKDGDPDKLSRMVKDLSASKTPGRGLGGENTQLSPLLKDLEDFTEALDLLSIEKAFKKFAAYFISIKSEYKTDEPSRKVMGLWGRELEIEKKGLSDILFIVDLSGSMRANVLAKAIEKIINLIKKRDKKLKIDLLPFADQAKIHEDVKLTYVDIYRLLNSSNVGSGTNVQPIIVVYEKLKKTYKGLVVFSDFQLGNGAGVEIPLFNEKLLTGKKMKLVPKLLIIVSSDLQGDLANMKRGGIKTDKRTIVTSMANR